MVGGCGNENLELSFFIGETNSRVDEGLKHYNNPTGFAFKETYDYATWRSRGFIWVSLKAITSNSLKSWNSLTHPLHGILLHEIGHVFGIGHVAGTIMTENIANQLFSPNVTAYSNHQIDQMFELYQQEGEEREFIGIPDFVNEKSQSVFELLTGVKPRGPVEAKLQFDRQSDKHPSFTIVLSDGAQHFVLQGQADQAGSSTYNGAQDVFKQVWKEPNHDRILTQNESLNNWVGYGKLTSVTGKQYLMSISYNTMNEIILGDATNDINLEERYSNNPYQVHIFDNFERRRVFGPSAFWFSRGEK